MKFFRIIFFIAIIMQLNYSCSKENKSVWDVSISKPAAPVEIIDVSKDFYNPQIPLEAFQKKYPWFQGSVSDEDFALRRKDSLEIKIYKEAIGKINQNSFEKELQNLFSHIQYYFPEFINPKVFLYSSSLQSATEPVFYRAQENYLFIDISGFLGEKNSFYKGLEHFYRINMNPENLLSKVSMVFAGNIVPYNRDNQKFIDELIYQGKLLTLQDAFLPTTSNHLKINLSQKQYDWSLANEVNIWNYFVENDLVYSDDTRLVERFIAPGPFSKFYTEIDNQSSPQVGIFIGWQIAKAFYQNKPETQLKDFLRMSAQDIFNEAKYHPKFKD